MNVWMTKSVHLPYHCYCNYDGLWERHLRYNLNLIWHFGFTLSKDQWKKSCWHLRYLFLSKLKLRYCSQFRCMQFSTLQYSSLTVWKRRALTKHHCYYEYPAGFLLFPFLQSWLKIAFTLCWMRWPYNCCTLWRSHCISRGHLLLMQVASHI